MGNAYKLLFETQPEAFEMETLLEQKGTSDEKQMFLSGVFGACGRLNQNGRVYQRGEMKNEITRYGKEMIDTGKSGGELNHPTEIFINPERICDRTVSLRLDESSGLVYGKALIADTPCGRIQRGLIDSGFRIGKSSRSLGAMADQLFEGKQAKVVQGMKVIAWDSVTEPSESLAMVDPLLESREYIMGDDGGFMQKPFEDLDGTLARLPRHGKEQYIVEAFDNFLKTIKFG